jgi:hypothetical protein
MNTLREIGVFVNQTQHVSMRQVGQDVPVLTIAEQTSMRAMILALQNLPPITLEVEFVATPGGNKVPVSPLIRVLPTKGVTLFTIFNVLSNDGVPIPGFQPDNVRGNFEGVRHIGMIHKQGNFRLSVTRTGTGPITLRKTLRFRTHH